MSNLFSPIIIKNVTLKNRIVVSPMCQYSAEDGFASDYHLVHLGSRAMGGAGLIISEAASVSPEGRISPGDIGIWKDEHITMLKRITDFIHEYGSVAGIQLAHAGRKASFKAPWLDPKQIGMDEGGWQTVAPSAVPFNEEDTIPEALSIAEIERLKADFKAAAERALKAGFKVIELHGAHGYLIHQFLSPLSNQRTDEYGGSFENRIRFLLELIENVQSVWPQENPLFVRISATDWAEGGWNADLIDVSSGGLAKHQQIPVFPGYQVQFADQIKKSSGMMTGAVGLITSAEQAEQILGEGKADLILLAREFLRDPYFPLHAAEKLAVELKWPVQYERAKPRKPH
jgi:2,4-dienoyl-CoA reductase-like NADH-dependent reductase (Old Yellow Enzyme family)